ncbi:MAG: MFS transporter [Jatrophihabitans sp.]|nr:MAG: MFS transporter [Jatrophihabitans sp.]
MSAVAVPVARRRTLSPVAGWLLAGSVYLLAVLHRTSLGVAGLLAEQRFGITPAQLGVFIFLQLGVYAAMQVPTGVLVDRYGPRRLLLVASTLMGIAQLAFALVPSYPAALLARALLGCGDALTFISVLRYAAGRFSPERYPVVVAITSLLGTVGNLIATLPLAVVLHHVGWGPGFAAAASFSLVAAAVVWVLLPEATPAPRPVRGAAAVRAGMGNVWSRVRRAWGESGTRLGFWVHFTCMSSATAFAVLWGAPYLQTAAGFSATGAGAVLMYGVIAAGIASPVIGAVIGRWPAARVPLALGVSAVTILGWLVTVLALGDRPPQVYVLALFVVMAVGAPASMAAFALARDYNHARALGTASGVVNVGGFLSTVIVALGIGWVLDALGGTTAHTMRYAALVAVAVQAFGCLRMAVWFRRTRAAVLVRQAAGQPVPVAVVRHRWDLAEYGS